MRYGIDAPYVPAILGVVAIGCLVAGFVIGSAGWLVVVGAVFALQVLVFMHTTLRGKLRAWRRLLDELHLAGDEQLLDVGCGPRRGARGAAQVKVRNLGPGFWYAGPWQATSAVTATKP